MQYTIDSMQGRDWNQVRAIYAQGLATGLAAFMSAPPTWKSWNASHLSVARFVARQQQAGLLGWSALAPVPDT